MIGMLRRWRRVVVVLLLMPLGFLVLRQITTAAFDGIEARQVAQDSQRLRIALDGQVRLLSNFGATNAVWDNAYTEVGRSDSRSFESDFPASQIRDMFDFDGLVGVGPDGQVRVGGVTDGHTYGQLPGDLATPAVLARTFDAAAPSGTPRCGVLSATGGSFVFCGFATFRSDGSGPASGGLVVLKSLGAPALAALGTQVDLPLTRVASVRSGGRAQPALSSLVGQINLTTRSLSSDRIAVDAVLASAAGPAVVIESVRDRPIHRIADRTATLIFVLGVVAMALLALAVGWLVRRGIRAQVGPLRRTADAVIASGDRGLRIGLAGTGEIPALAAGIDRMLDAMARQDADLHAEHEAREADLRRGHAEQQRVESAAQHQAEQAIAAAIAQITSELQDVIDQVALAGQASVDIDQRVEVAYTASATATEQAHRTGAMITELTASLRRVEGIAKLIATVAGQTNLLALNATIEAARAGEAGRGFAVVASEVKQLATSTAESTGDIATTLDELEARITMVAQTVDAMATGIGELNMTSDAVREVSRRQREVMDQLRHRVSSAQQHIAGLGHGTAAP